MGGAPHRGLARPWCGRAWRSPNRRAADRFDRVAISSGSLAGAGESRSAAERHGSPRATVPTSARATSRIRGRGDRPQGRLERRRSRASCCRSARFQERGRCGPSAQRAECKAERIRGTLLRRLAWPATHIQRGDRYFGQRQVSRLLCSGGHVGHGADRHRACIRSAGQ